MNIKPNIILIGGAQSTGKTTLAKELSSRLNMPWISTDQIRTICGITPKGKEKLVEEIGNNEKLWKHIERFIRSPFPWESVIIEGVAILPHLVASLDIKVSSVFIIDTDIERTKEVVRQRSLLPWINTKTESEQQKRVRYINEFNSSEPLCTRSAQVFFSAD